MFCSEDFAFLRQLTQYVPLARPVTVLDAGANVGLATILFAEAIRFNGQVVSVDANPGTMKVRSFVLQGFQMGSASLHSSCGRVRTAFSKRTCDNCGAGLLRGC